MNSQLRPSINPIDVVGASAGTGKTYQLCRAFIDAINGTALPGPVQPSNIITTTFTTKAANELIDRIRERLMENDNWEAAQQVLNGYIGTVNSVCARLVSEFAIDGGLSPVIDVLPEERTQAVFAAAAEPVIAKYMIELDPIARRLSHDDWRALVLQISRIARANGISPDELDSCAQKSWNSLKKLLPQLVGTDNSNLNSDLYNAIQQALMELSTTNDTTQATAAVLNELRRCAAILRSGESLKWSDWAKLSKLKGGKSSETIINPVKNAASIHHTHPRLHDDLSSFIKLSFACASEAMIVFETYKRLLGFIDFTDQESLACKLLDDPSVNEKLRQRLSVILVDEFQDTSPIQLALFLKLSRIADKSIWVGDEKQAIYGFRDTDPELMQSVIQAVVPQSGGSSEHLVRSYRTVPELVAFSNDLFAQAFSAIGICSDKVIITECERDSLTVEANLHAWWIEGTRWDQAIGALATAVSDILACPEQWQVLDPSIGSKRPIRGNDIAILCRRNERCAELSSALASNGLKVAAARHGLLSTPECSFAFAAFRYLVDAGDTVAVAELVHFSADDVDSSNWLSRLLDKGLAELVTSLPQIQALNNARSRLGDLTPGESLELAIRSARIFQIVSRWTNFRQRLSNLDAMRALARQYEELCLAQRSSATAAGFVTFLFKELDRNGSQPPNPDENAVRVLTYHAAKGLEWPLVILFDLGSPKEASVFGLIAETEDGAANPWEPLRGRWIRSWPWPYGLQQKGTYLDAAADTCAEMIRARGRTRAENIRLMYVGATRARDYLVFACRDSKDGTAWLDSLTDEAGDQLLVLPEQGGMQLMNVGGHMHSIAVRLLAPPAPVSNLLATPSRNRGDVFRLQPDSRNVEHPPLHAAPSSLTVPAVIQHDNNANLISLGGRLPISGSPNITILGEALHRFLSADNIDWNISEREALAQDILSRWSVTELQPESLLESADRLHRFLAERYPGHRAYREHPVSGRVGLQRISGRMDLLIETDRGFAIVDHKSFPGAYESWVGKACSYKPQLEAYAEMVRAASGRDVLDLFVHMPIVGKVVEIG